MVVIEAVGDDDGCDDVVEVAGDGVVVHDCFRECGADFAEHEDVGVAVVERNWVGAEDLELGEIFLV